MRFNTKERELPNIVSRYNKNELFDVGGTHEEEKEILIKNSRIIDPLSGIDKKMDIIIKSGKIVSLEDNIIPKSDSFVIDAEGMWTVPGLLDIHLHVYDIPTFHVSIMEEAAIHGVTSALSPGAMNTIRITSFMGAEIDRGSLINIGCFVGAPSILSFDIGDDKIVDFLKGDMSEEEVLQTVCRSRIAARTIPFLIGLKDHHSHMILSAKNMERAAKIAYESELLFMSHAQCPEYAEDIAKNTKKYPLHFGHTDASACGSHGESEDSFNRLLNLIRNEDRISGEFTSTLLRPGLGDRNGISITKKAQELAFEALREKVVDIIVSDSPLHAVKGFGDTKDSVPLLVELIENNILSPIDAVATMTTNPAKLLSKATKQDWWFRELGSLQLGTRADLIVINPLEKEVVYTFVNGRMVAFEGRVIPSSYGSGGLITKYGILSRVGLADMGRFKYVK